MSAVISDNAMTVLRKRYLAPGETVDGMFRRVAGGDESAYRMMADLDFLPNSPALMNAGTDNGCTFFACFHFCVDDTFFETENGIFPTRAKAAMCAKAGGGVGYYFGAIRPKGELIRSVHRKACGPVAVLKDYQGVRQLVTQGGKRDLAQMGILPAWHPDIREFIHVKDEDPEALNSFNISVSWQDDELKSAFSDPDSEFGKLWAEQVDSAWRTGDPGCWFFSRVNRTNPTPWIGVLRGTNPCFTGDTKVWTIHGPRRFDQLVGSEVPVLTQGRDGELLFRAMRGIRMTRRGADVYRVRLKSNRRHNGTVSGKFVATGDHLVFLRDGSQVPVKDLKVGDRLASVYLNHEVVSVEYAGRRDVYDGTVDEFHRFFIVTEDNGGVLVHNCGEVDLLNDEPCDLGSINLSRFVDRGSRTMDFDRLEEAVRAAIRFLDKMHDRTPFPHPAIAAAAARTRKIGLGVMGWADLLALLGIHYDSEEAVDLAIRVASFIEELSIAESLKLAGVFGPYPGYHADQATSPPSRNATRTCIAPTGTISLIAGCSSGIEPHYALEWERTTYEGIKMVERIPVWDRLEGFMPRTANEIGWRWHVRHQAAWQRYTDLAVSKTINLPNSATRQDISDAYRTMWESDCKGGTVFRDGCRSEQVLVARKTKSVYSTGIDSPELSAKLATGSCRRKLPTDRRSLTHKFHISGFEGYLTVGLYEDGSPGEIFLKASKEGTTISGLLDAWAIAVSVALQYGAPLDTLVRLYSGTRFEPNGLTRNPDLRTCSSVADYVFRYLGKLFGFKMEDGSSADPDNKGVVLGDSGLFCPECGKQALYQAGCLICPDRECGWTKCG